jgi:hypothetical protein
MNGTGADTFYRVLNTHQMELERQGIDRWQLRQTIMQIFIQLPAGDFL